MIIDIILSILLFGNAAFSQTIHMTNTYGSNNDGVYAYMSYGIAAPERRGNVQVGWKKYEPQEMSDSQKKVHADAHAEATRLNDIHKKDQELLKNNPGLHDYQKTKDSFWMTYHNIELQVGHIQRNSFEYIRGMDVYEQRKELLEIAIRVHDTAYALAKEQECWLTSIGPSVYQQSKEDQERNKRYKESIRYLEYWGWTVADVATSIVPVVSTIRDVYEAFTGKDFFSQEPLTAAEHTMAILGTITIGGSNFYMKLGTTIAEMVGAAKVIEKISGAAEPAQKVVKLLYEKSLTELKESVRFLKENGPSFLKNDKKELKNYINAFENGTYFEVLKEDLKVVRYYRANSPASARGYWVTERRVFNPYVTLALTHNDPLEIVEWVIPTGTKVMRGRIAPQEIVDKSGKLLYARQGGGTQIFVNKEILK